MLISSAGPHSHLFPERKGGGRVSREEEKRRDEAHTPSPFDLASALSITLWGSGQGHSVFWFLNTMDSSLRVSRLASKIQRSFAGTFRKLQIRRSLNGCKPQLLQNWSFQSKTVQSPHSDIQIIHNNPCLTGRPPPPTTSPTSQPPPTTPSLFFSHLSS